ncbi:MAG: DUF5131 family protein [Patescibacteria group bacterium]|nr:DUF5131 family protein [Patescibacteria group bacterium]
MKLWNSIGWCDATTNGVTGCDKVSPGCKNCYAEVGTRARVLRAQGIETWGPKGVRHPVNFEPVFQSLQKACVCNICAEAYAEEKLDAIDKSCACGGTLRRIRLFADSNSDFLDDRWPIETLARFLDAIRLAPNVDVLLLTKRPENLRKQIQTMLTYCDLSPQAEMWDSQWMAGLNIPKHIWLGISVENQAMADKRIPELLKIPAAIRFLSVEPLLEKVNLCLGHKPAFENKIDWVIVGGESGKNRRDCGVEAILSVADQCKTAGVPCYVKQDTAFKPGQQGRIPNEYWTMKQFPK